MTDQAPSSPDFIRQRLPWIAGGVMLVVYLVTINRWVRLESLPVVAKVIGWDWSPIFQGQLSWLIMRPLALLPGSVALLALNVLHAVMGAVTLGLLARCVALLPFDRTHETRLREHDEQGWLSIGLAWLPPLAAVLLCGLQLTFWENATAATGEMLDLLIFGYLVRCLLEFRIDGRERWLTRLSLLYGVALANNYALAAWFPCFLVAIIWIRGYAFFDWRFLLRMTAWGAAGLLAYLVLPLVGFLRGDGDLSFWGFLRLVLGSQKESLLSFPRFAILLLSLQCLLPVLIMGLRSRSNQGETSAAGAAITALVVRGIHLLMFALCVTVFLDLKWGPRTLSFGFVTLLPMFFIAALGLGYYAGYLLLVAQRVANRHWGRESGLLVLVGQLGRVLVLAVALGGPVWLVYQNYPTIRRNDGRALAGMARLMIQSLPQQRAFLLSDNGVELLLVAAALQHEGIPNPHVLVQTSLLPFVPYHQQLARRYPKEWPVLPAERFQAGGSLDLSYLMTLIGGMVRQGEVYYLHPTVGYYLEMAGLEPQGLVCKLVPLPENLAAPRQSEERVAANLAFWQAAAPELAGVAAYGLAEDSGTRYLRASYGRALNNLGVALERQGRGKEAGGLFEAAVRVNPECDPAKVNLAFNRDLLDGKAAAIKLSPPVVNPTQNATWEESLLAHGPFDHPAYLFQIAQLYLRGGLIYQAYDAFRRVAELLPDEAAVILGRDNAEALTRLSRGDVAGAERQALELVAKYPTAEAPLVTLVQIQLQNNRLTEAQESVRRLLAINPANESGLLNSAVIAIRQQDYATAAADMDKLLASFPKHAGALLNRALANLQLGKLDNAEEDFLALKRLMPDNPAPYAGLGQIAVQRQNNRQALDAYQRYLELGPRGTPEYAGISNAVVRLKAGK